MDANRINLLLIRLEAVGFSIGSLLFVLGAAVAQWRPADIETANGIFVVGAAFFTVAAAIQWELSRRHQLQDVAEARAAGREVHNSWRNPDWIASAVQFVGTLYFNVMTIHAYTTPIDSAAQGNSLVWRPDFIGSGLFLISSLIAWHPVSRRLRHHHVPERSVWICDANLLGSIAFGVSAVAARYLSADQVRDATVANVATMVGGALFLIGAVLILPRWDRWGRQVAS